MRGTCNTCGNTYHDVFEVTMDGETYTFDSFECAIHELAPTCPHCGIRVVGHGVDQGGQVYCCTHCAEAS